MTNDILAQRLRQAREHLGKTQSEMAELAGVKFRTWQDYEAGKSTPPGRVYAKIRAHGFDGSWLLGAPAPMLSDEGRTEGGPSLPSPPELRSPGEEYVALPRYDVQAAAGPGAITEAERVVDWIYFKKDWLRRTLGVAPQHLAVIEAVGDSMVPTIDDGDLLIVDLSQPKLNGDGIYVLSVDDSLAAIMVKRIEITPRGGLIISSDNARAGYGRYEIAPGELDQVRIVGRVVWVGGRI